MSTLAADVLEAVGSSFIPALAEFVPQPTSLSGGSPNFTSSFSFSSSSSTTRSSYTTEPLPGLPTLEFTPYRSSIDTGIVPDEESVLDAAGNRGMRVLYEVSNWVIHQLQPEEFPDRLHEVSLVLDLLSDNDLTSADSLWASVKQNYARWITYDQGILASGGVCVVIAAVFTLVALVILCCKCCATCFCCSNKKGAKVVSSRAANAKSAARELRPVPRAICHVLLSLLTVIMLFCVVCAFISNEYTHQSVRKLPSRLKSNVDELSFYRDDTAMRFEHLLVNDYSSLDQTIMKALNASGDVTVQRLKEVTGAISLDLLSKISSNADQIERNLTAMVSSISSLMDSVQQLIGNMTNISREIFKVVDESCSNAAGNLSREENTSCNNVRQAFKQIENRQEVRFVKDELFSILSSGKATVMKIVEANIARKLEDGRLQFVNIKSRMDNAINAEKDAAARKLGEGREKLAEVARQLKISLNKLDVSDVKGHIFEYEPALEFGEKYRWIGSLILTSVLAFTVLSFGFGLFFGICGKHSVYYDDDYCCNRAVGSKFFCTAIAFCILCVFIFMVLSIGLFIIGANTETIGCEPLENPTHPTGALKLAERYIGMIKQNELQQQPDLKRMFDRASLELLIRGCQHNDTLFNILKLDEEFGLEQIRGQQDKLHQELDSILGRLKSQQGSILPEIRRLITPEVEQELQRISAVKIEGVNDHLLTKINEYSDILNSAEVVQNLQQIASDRATALKIPYEAKQAILRGIEQLRGMHQGFALPLIRRLKSLVENITITNKAVSELLANVPELLDQLKRAEQLLSNNFNSFVSSVLNQLAESLLRYVDRYVDHVHEQLTTNISSCQPLAAIAKSVGNNICERTVNPFNGFWASCVLCLILLMPSSLLAYVLRQSYVEKLNFYSTALSMSGASLTPSTVGRGRRSDVKRTNGYIRDYENYYAETTRPYGRTSHQNGITSTASRAAVANGTTRTNVYASHNGTASTAWKGHSVGMNGTNGMVANGSAANGSANYFDNIVSPPPYNYAATNGRSKYAP